MWFAIWRWSVFVPNWYASSKRFSCPHGSVGMTSLLRWQTAGGGSIPRWSVSKTQDRRPAERQRARKKKSKLQTVYQKERFWSFVVYLSLSLTNSDIQTWQATICNAHNSASHEDKETDCCWRAIDLTNTFTALPIAFSTIFSNFSDWQHSCRKRWSSERQRVEDAKKQRINQMRMDCKKRLSAVIEYKETSRWMNMRQNLMWRRS